jgi:hypothetical protein
MRPRTADTLRTEPFTCSQLLFYRDLYRNLGLLGLALRSRARPRKSRPGAPSQENQQADEHDERQRRKIRSHE